MKVLAFLITILLLGLAITWISLSSRAPWTTRAPASVESPPDVVSREALPPAADPTQADKVFDKGNTIRRIVPPENELGALTNKLNALIEECARTNPALRVIEAYRNVPREWFNSKFAAAEHRLNAYIDDPDLVLKTERQRAFAKIQTLLSVAQVAELVRDVKASNFVRIALTPVLEHPDSKYFEKFFTMPPKIVAEYNLSLAAATAAPGSTDMFFETAQQNAPEHRRAMEAIASAHSIPDDILVTHERKRLVILLTEFSDLYLWLTTPPELTELRSRVNRLTREADHNNQADARQ